MSEKEQPLPIVARKLGSLLDIAHALKESSLRNLKDIKFGRVSLTNKAVVPHFFRGSEVVIFDTSENWPKNGDRVILFIQGEIWRG